MPIAEGEEPEGQYGNQYPQRPSAVGQDAGESNIVEPAPPAPPPSSVLWAPSARRAAGFSLLIAAAGTAIGATFGGLWGAGAGLLGAGALRNAARARKHWGSEDAAAREEAASSATMAVVGGAASAYLGYRAYQDREE
jgi:hypothetical protein